MSRRALTIALLGLAACDRAPRSVDYYSDVQPILQTHCTRCHQPAGVAPFDLSTPEAAVAWSAVIAQATASQQMPPPVSDPACRDYLGSEHLALPDRSRAILARWVALDTPLGDPASAVPGRDAPPSLDDADLHLSIPPYAPTFTDTNNPANEYRCFVLEHGRDSDFFVTALHPNIDEAGLVHHMVIGAVDRSTISDEFDHANGEDCLNNDMGAIENMLAAWAPGAQPQVFAEGAGMRVGADQVLILQLHYYLSDPALLGTEDTSGYGLRTAATADTPLKVLTLGSSSFRIPANDPDYRFGEGWTPSEDLRVHGVFPHMHALGAGYRMWRDDDEADDCLVSAERYDFHNQLTYLFTEPMEVAAGETLSWECAWDNSPSSPDRLTPAGDDVFYGERSDEEMCFFFTIVEE